MTVEWSKRVICHCRVLWQESHAAWVRMCLADLPVAATELWQSAQIFGVPLKRPSAWQDSQVIAACAPVSGKPVLK